MGIFRTNSEAGKPIRSWPQRLNAILQSFCEALGIQMDQTFSGPQVIPISSKGAPNGVCELDANAKVPMSRLYVSATSAPNIIPITGADGKLSPTFFSGISTMPYATAKLDVAGPLTNSNTYPQITNVTGPLSSLFDGTKFWLPVGNDYLVSVNVYIYGYGVVNLALEEGLVTLDMMSTIPGTILLPRYFSVTRIVSTNGMILPFILRPSLRIAYEFSNISSRYDVVGSGQSSLSIVKLNVV